MRDASGSRTTGGRIRSHIGTSRDLLRKGHSTGFDKLRLSLNVCYVPCIAVPIHIDGLVIAPTARYPQLLSVAPCTIACSVRPRAEMPKHSL